MEDWLYITIGFFLVVGGILNYAASRYRDYQEEKRKDEEARREYCH